MPETKDVDIRYRLLDRCLSDTRHRYTIDDLVEVVNRRLYDILGKNVCKRTIQKDLEQLCYRPYCAPIESYKGAGRRHYIHYSNPDFSIYNNDLSPDEVEKLRSTIEMFSRFRGTAANAWLEEAISNLEYRFGIKANTEQLVAFEQNDRLKGLEHLSGLIDATISHQTIEIDYVQFNGRRRVCTVFPYYVKQYNGRWFVLGQNAASSRIENYALDRINSFKEVDVPFLQNDQVDFNSYFDDVVGVSVPYGDIKPVKIVLRFKEQRYPYVISKPIHHSQQVGEAPFTVSITVIPTRELTQQILSFGPDVEVISPESLRAEISKKIEESFKNYQTTNNDCTVQP